MGLETSTIHRVFLDTEFTDLSANAALISAGLVADDGREFYAELADFRETDCNPFVLAQVLPLLGPKRVSTASFVQSVATWLGNWTSHIVLVADSDKDWTLLKKTFALAEQTIPAQWSFEQVPACFVRGSQRQVFDDEMSAYFLRHPEERRHHALADARALHCAYRRAVADW